MPTFLSPVLANDASVYRRIVRNFSIFTFFLTLSFIFSDRLLANKTDHDASIERVQDYVQDLAPPIDALDYDFVQQFAIRLTARPLVSRVIVEDVFGFTIVDTALESGAPEPEREPSVRVIDIDVVVDDGDVETGRLVGMVQLFVHEFRYYPHLSQAFLLAVLLTSAVVGPLTLVLVFMLNKYVGEPLNQLTTAIQNSVEQKQFSVTTYQSDSAFGRLAQSFNQMQLVLGEQFDQTQRLMRENKDRRQAAERAADALRIERDRRHLEAQIIGSLLHAKSQIVAYMTLDGEVHSNLDRFADLSQEMVLDFFTAPVFSNEEVLAWLQAWENDLEEHFQITNASKTLDGPTNSYVFRSLSNEIWLIELMILSDVRAVFFSDYTEMYVTQNRNAQEEKLTSLGALASGVAHDFNNLLSVVSAATESISSRVLASDRSDGQEILDDLDMISNSATRAGGIVSHLLDFSRSKKLEKDRINLSEFLKGLRNLISTIMQANIRLGIETEPDLFVEVNVDQFQTSIMNIATNAKHAMRNGGTFTIKAFGHRATECGLSEDQVIISLSDTGTGIDPKVMTRVFEPFFTTKKEKYGTGLGLYMAYQFATQSQGSINCVSMLGEGTEIKIALPRVQLRSESKEQTRKTFVEKRLGGRIIAVVEDEVSLLMLIERFLRTYGATVFPFDCVKDFEAAVSDADFRPELIVSDHTLTDGRSNDVSTARKTYAPGCRMIVCTGHRDEIVDDMLQRGDILDVIEKPFVVGDLIASVDSALNVSHEYDGGGSITAIN